METHGQGAHKTVSWTLVKGKRSRAPFNKELGTGCAAKTSKSFSLPKSRPERSSNPGNVIDN